MTAQEAREYQDKLHQKEIDISWILNSIEDKCKYSLERETTVQADSISDEQIEKLKGLGYDISYNRACLWYIISW